MLWSSGSLSRNFWQNKTISLFYVSIYLSLVQPLFMKYCKESKWDYWELLVHLSCWSKAPEKLLLALASEGTPRVVLLDLFCGKFLSACPIRGQQWLPPSQSPRQGKFKSIVNAKLQREVQDPSRDVGDHHRDPSGSQRLWSSLEVCLLSQVSFVSKALRF